jgi:hypothetical protein
MFQQVCMAAGLCILQCAFAATPQTNSPAPVFPSNRYLLVVETSRAMQKRGEGLTQSVRDVLGSALASQARQGDTLGLWIFNEELYTGGFPLQHWSPDAQKAITDRIVGFLKTQKFENSARLDKVIAALDRLAHNSSFLTVVLVCMGDQEIHGTPFDQRINDSFRTWRTQQTESGKPFLLALRAQGGRFVEFSMNPTPWPAELPALPKELFVPLPPAPLASAPKSQTSVPNLIISGKKKATTAPANVASSDAKGQLTNASPVTEPPVTSSNAVVANAAAAESSIPTPLTGESGNPQAPGSGGVANVSPSTSLPQPVIAASAQVAPPLSDEQASASPANRRSPTESQAVVTQESRPSAGSSAVPAPQPSLSDKISPATSSPAAEQIRKARIEMGTAPSSNRGLSPMILWSGVTVCVFLAAGILILARRRRSRPVRDISLITESFDRRKS